MNSRAIGEALLWLGIATMAAAAVLVDHLTGDAFVGVFTTGAVLLAAGVALMTGTRRPR